MAVALADALSALFGHREPPQRSKEALKEVLKIDRHDERKLRESSR